MNRNRMEKSFLHKLCTTVKYNVWVPLIYSVSLSRISKSHNKEK